MGINVNLFCFTVKQVKIESTGELQVEISFSESEFQW
jgi:hypothetical protein